jgi:hypothetical protein
MGAMDALNVRLVAADAIGQAMDAAAGDNPPAWVHVYRAQVETIREAAEALECLLRGDGGCAPHGGWVAADPSDLRGQSGTLPGSDSRPD